MVGLGLIVLAAVDVWLLPIQLHDWVHDGLGRDFFGPQQPIAIEATDKILQLVEEFVKSQGGNLDGEGTMMMRDFARQHPITGSEYVDLDAMMVEIDRIEMGIERIAAALPLDLVSVRDSLGFGRQSGSLADEREDPPIRTTICAPPWIYCFLIT